jgi:hypothetical protein
MSLKGDHRVFAVPISMPLLTELNSISHRVFYKHDAPHGAFLKPNSNATSQ